MTIQILVYGKPNCEQCTQTCKRLTALGLSYHYSDVTTDPDARAHVDALGYLSLPVVVVGDMHWSGYRHDSIKRLAEMHAAAVIEAECEADAVAEVQDGAA